MFPPAVPGAGPPAALWRALLQQARASEKREPVVDAEVFLSLIAQEHLYASGVLPRPSPATTYPYGFLLSPAAAPPQAPPPAMAPNRSAPAATVPQAAAEQEAAAAAAAATGASQRQSEPPRAAAAASFLSRGHLKTNFS